MPERRLRILIVQLSASYAGTERHASELAAGLAAAHDVATVLRARPRAAGRQAQYDALLASVSPRVRLFVVWRALAWLGVLVAVLRFRPDVIHAHYERSVRLACRVARLFGVPVIGTIHTRYSAPDFARCTALVALTEAERARAACAFPRELAVIENWVQPWPRPGRARIAALRAEFGVGDAFVFGCVGRLEPVKRMDLLIDAFARAGLPQARLVIIGEGSARPALAAQVARLGLPERVILAPFRRDVRDCYAVFGCFVSASSFDPFALTLLEAAEQLVPIISTATEAAVAIARRSPITLVPHDDAPALAAALRAAMAGPAQGPPLKGFAFADRLPQFEALYRGTLTGNAA
jgi:glycosyltransferase involved in cell wall biosynthesis